MPNSLSRWPRYLLCPLVVELNYDNPTKNPVFQITPFHAPTYVLRYPNELRNLKSQKKRSPGAQSRKLCVQCITYDLLNNYRCHIKCPLSLTKHTFPHYFYPPILKNNFLHNISHSFLFIFHRAQRNHIVGHLFRQVVQGQYIGCLLPLTPRHFPVRP